MIVSAIMVSAGLWPFHFFQENNVHWIRGGRGLRFAGPGIAFIRLSSDNTLSPLAPGRPLTLEFVVVPEEEPSHSVPQLLTFCDAQGNQLLAVGQWKSSLIIRSAIPGRHRPGAYSETGASGLLIKQKPRHVIIVSRGSVLAIYAGGKPAKERRDFPLFRRGDASPDLVVVGNSSTGKSPWKGDLLYLAIHDRILSPEEIAERYSRREDQGTPEKDSGAVPLMEYTFEDRDGDVARTRAGERFPLSISRSFRPTKRIFLEFPDPKELFTRSNIIDIFVNVFGFLPFGILVAELLKTKPGGRSTFRMIFLLILAGGVFSLCIEIVQGFLPNRSSSLLDVIANVLGTLIGGGLFFGFSREEGGSLKRSGM
jgi:VanZ family protein